MKMSEGKKEKGGTEKKRVKGERGRGRGAHKMRGGRKKKGGH